MRRFALLGVACLILAMAAGVTPTQLAAEDCGMATWSTQVNGCCGNHAKVDRWVRLYCTGTGWRGPVEYAGYSCVATCQIP